MSDDLTAILAPFAGKMISGCPRRFVLRSIASLTHPPQSIIGTNIGVATHVVAAVGDSVLVSVGWDVGVFLIRTPRRNLAPHGEHA